MGASISTAIRLLPPSVVVRLPSNAGGSEDMPLAYLPIPKKVFGTCKGCEVHGGNVQDSMQYMVSNLKLGEGAFGKVRLAQARPNSRSTLQPGAQFAVKTVNILAAKRRGVTEAMLSQELIIHMEASKAQEDLLAHPLIVKLYDVFAYGHEVSVVMERLGPSMRQYMQKVRSVRVEKARQWAGELASTLHFLHNKQHVCHRDLTSNNVLLDKDDKPEHIRLGDFGFATPCKDSNSLCNTTFCGSISYMSPEKLADPDKPLAYNGQMADMWSFGVVTLEMYGVANPFANEREDHDLRVICKNITDESFMPPRPKAAGVGADDLTFIQGLLKRPVKERLTSADAVSHPLFHPAAPGTVAQQPPVREQEGARD